MRNWNLPLASVRLVKLSSRTISVSGSSAWPLTQRSPWPMCASTIAISADPGVATAATSAAAPIRLLHLLTATHPFVVDATVSGEAVRASRRACAGAGCGRGDCGELLRRDPVRAGVLHQRVVGDRRDGREVAVGDPFGPVELRDVVRDGAQR